MVRKWSVLGFSVLVEGLNLLPSSAGHLPVMLMALTWVPRVSSRVKWPTLVSSLLRRELAVLRRTLAGRDGETCSRDLRQSPPSSRLCDLDLGTMWERMVLPSESEMVGFFSGSNLPSKSKSPLPKPRDAP